MTVEASKEVVKDVSNSVDTVSTTNISDNTTQPIIIDPSINQNNDAQTPIGSDIEERVAQVTMEADYFAIRYLSILLFPMIFASIIYSLVYEKHASWYSWFISSLTSCVYTFGFITMCPQLYINHQLKSVSHLPWQYLIYKFLNTFVDGKFPTPFSCLCSYTCSSLAIDLFAFIIKMPMMHRLSVFRDDIVFFVYIYQRYIYQVDMNRPIEK